MSELLIELFSEEMPALMQKNAALGYKKIFKDFFTCSNISYSELNVYYGPRRITIYADGLPLTLPPEKVEKKGPKTDAPDQAIAGFCSANKINKSDLTIKEIKNNKFYFYEYQTKEKNISDIIKENASGLIDAYVWPKSMRWGSNDIKYVRPLQNILCVFEGKKLEFNHAHIVSNNVTWGHKFMSSKASNILNFTNYCEFLNAEKVILSAEERRNIIQNGLQKYEKELGLELKEDDALLEEVTGLVEYPVVLVGKIKEKFLQLPKEALISAMRSHQKYFSMLDNDDNFAPYFLFVSNIESSDENIVIHGNEKVLAARLEDALHFYNQDLKTSLEDKSTKLDKVIFHAKLGSIKDKSKRLVNLVKYLNPEDKNAQIAATICKADIVSEMVDEFPTLQGIMGYYYALNEGRPQEVANAVRLHYKPQGPNDAVPKNSSAILAIADKIDSICGLMLAGEKPSGSKDPHALRRLTLGVIRIIIENKISINLIELMHFAAKQYEVKLSIKDENIKEILLFILERAMHYFKNDYDYKAINSVLNFEREGDLAKCFDKLCVIDKFIKSEEGEILLNIYKRINNILGKTDVAGSINEDLLENQYEISLHKTARNIEPQLIKLIDEKQYFKALTLLNTIQNPLEEFFENIMVKDSNIDVANNRIALLLKIKYLFKLIADFDKL